jgi:hypothetical protein
VGYPHGEQEKNAVGGEYPRRYSILLKEDVLCKVGSYLTIGFFR